MTVHINDELVERLKDVVNSDKVRASIVVEVTNTQISNTTLRFSFYRNGEEICYWEPITLSNNDTLIINGLTFTLE